MILLVTTLALGELLFVWWWGERNYSWRETVSNITLGIGQQAINAYIGGSMLLLYVAVESRVGLLDFRMDVWWHWVLLLLISDFCYYVAHRTSHARNFWVAGHIVHHQAEEFNFVSSFRQGWTAWIVNSMFFVPLPLLGFPMEMTVVGQAGILVVQFLAHNGVLRRRLGPLEWVFVTPANHRVHHGMNAPYLGANCGGMFSIWDRLFGTYHEETADNPVQMGTSIALNFYDPFEANLDYYRRLAFVSRHRSGWGRIGIWFSTPDVLLDECERLGYDHRPRAVLDRSELDLRRKTGLVALTGIIVSLFAWHRSGFDGNPWVLRILTGIAVMAGLWFAARALSPQTRSLPAGSGASSA